MSRRAWSAAATTRAREAVSWLRASLSCTAVATRSAKSASRASTSGAGARSVAAMISAPQVRPSTVTGTPVPLSSPRPRSRSAIGPVAPV